MRMLIQTQLSNYDAKGRFILECDSGWQMVMGRVKEILTLLPDSKIDIIGPRIDQLITEPEMINKEIFENENVKYYGIRILPNALETRYDFDMFSYAYMLNLKRGERYDWVYINDPMHLRNFKALFHIHGGYQPKFAVHSHFIDNPGAPKFPTDASLWWGQIEASVRSDVNFWQCQSAFEIYKEEAKRQLSQETLDKIVAKSIAWDDGYSSKEVNQVIDESKLRFDTKKFMFDTNGKTVIFVPNRVGGRGRSSDYTNCGKFLFEILPELHKFDKDIVVIAGNPSQKFLNKELEDELGKYGFMNLVPDSLRRDEYLYVAKHSNLVMGLYNQDSYGGTASRECIDLGCFPVWLDNYEYASIAREWFEQPPCLAKTNFSDLVDTTLRMITFAHSQYAKDSHQKLRKIVYDRCSYEATTKNALNFLNGR